MKNNVVDNLSDDYFMNEYRDALYIHENKLYKLKGFNVNGVSVSGSSRISSSGGMTKETFDNNIDHLLAWIEERNSELDVLMDNEPQKYHTWEDDDGEIQEDDETSEDWDDWDEQVRHLRYCLEGGTELRDKWNAEPVDGAEDCLEFIPLFDKDAQILLLPIKDFTSLKGFNIPEGFINLEKRSMHINYRRSFKVNVPTVEEILENPENARQFVAPTYPTLKEAIRMLRIRGKGRSIAISKNMTVAMENTQRKGETRFMIYDKDNEPLAHWIDGQKTITARNSKIMAVLSKKG